MDWIEDKTPMLSRSGKRIAQWVVAHPRQAASSTVAEIARICETSEPTVIRFCRALGLEGFREFSHRLTESLSQPSSYVHQDVGADNTSQDAVIKVVDSSIASLVQMRASLSAMPIESAVRVLAQARQICFAGLGASGHVARDAAHKFFRLGVPCQAITDLPSMLQFAAITEPQDVLMMISSTGHRTEFIRVARTARKQGASVLAVTNPESPLGEEADILLPCITLENTNVYTPMSSRLAHLALLDAIQVAMALSLGDAAVKRLRQTKDVLQVQAPE